MDQMTTAAREAIRIAEGIFPTDLKRQKSLAMEIVGAIEICEIELGNEIVNRIIKAQTAPQSPAQSLPSELIENKGPSQS